MSTSTRRSSTSPTSTAYRDALATYGLVSEMVEVPIVNDEFRAAGTADRICRTTKPLITPDRVRIEPGELIIGDLKTGKKLDFCLPGYCVQMALYATGQLYDVVTERRLATPPINQRLGAARPPARRQGALRAAVVLDPRSGSTGPSWPAT